MSASMDCPVCGLINPPRAVNCDCGYDFKTGTSGSSHNIVNEGVLRQLFDARGRSTRSLYAQTIFGSFGVLTLVGMLAAAVHIAFVILPGLLLLAIGIIAQIRRLHDRDESGWLVLMSLIPVMGTVWFLYLLFAPSVEPRSPARRL